MINQMIRIKVIIIIQKNYLIKIQLYKIPKNKIIYQNP